MRFAGSLLAMAILTVGVTDSSISLAAGEVQRTIVGYSSALSVRPGDTVGFMVSALDDGEYEADLVRVINGDRQSRYKDKFEVRALAAPLAGSYEGRPQTLNLGSYVQRRLRLLQR